MALLADMRFYAALVATSIKSSMSVKGAFIVEALLMLVNNLIFFMLWWLFFRQFQNIGGWEFKDMMALMAIGSGAYGIMLVFFGGVRFMSRTIATGELDAFMTQPKSLLFHLAGSRSHARGWGDIATMLLFILCGGLHREAPLIFLGAITGSLVFSSMGIIAHSLSFWLGPIENLAKQYCDSLVVFSLYPQNIYSGFFKLLMFTAIPAGVIGLLPVELIKHFSWTSLASLLAVVFLFCITAWSLFQLGLRRYESGNQFISRA